MKRRQVILGLGASATGGSALLGSGAFSSVSAERDISVEVAGDDSAYLRLGPCTDEDGNEKPNGAYAFQGEDGLFSISLSDNNGNSPPDGSGVNPEALSKFHNVFEICNQGTQEVCVNFGIDGDVPTIPDDAHVPERFDFGTGDDAVVFYKGSDESDTFDITSSDADDGFELDVGDCQCFGFNVRAFGFDSGEDLFADTDMTIIADADAECGDVPAPGAANLQAEIHCYSSDAVGDDPAPVSTNALGENVGAASTVPDSAGFAILDSPDQGSIFENGQTFDPGEEFSLPIDTGLPLRGIVFWDSEGETAGADKRDEFETSDAGFPDLNEDAVGEGSGSLAALDQSRYEEVKNDVGDFGEFSEKFDESELPNGIDELEDIVTEDKFVSEIILKDYEIDSGEDWDNGDVGIPNCDEL